MCLYVLFSGMCVGANGGKKSALNPLEVEL